MTARQPHDTTPRCPDCGWEGATSTPALAAFALARHSCATHRRRVARTKRRLDRLNTPGPTRECQHPRRHHRHGTNAAYILDRCRCLPCRTAHREHHRARERAKVYGRYNKWADGDEVRAHLAHLATHGIGSKRVAQVSGVSYGSIGKLLYGWRGHAPSRRVLRATADAILAVQPGLDTLAAGARISSVGSTRRLQALVALGWSQSKLAVRLGVLPSNFTALVHGQRDIVVSRARDVRTLYEQMSMRLPPQDTHRDKIAASRARNYARRKGWLPPLALDDDRLDDPGYDPLAHRVDDTPPGLDDVAILRRLDGDTGIRLTKAERIELVRRCRRDGWSFLDIERRTGIGKPERYLRSEGATA